MITIKVECIECGAPLRATMPIPNKLEVEPCPKCIEKATDEGYETGEADGRVRPVAALGNIKSAVRHIANLEDEYKQTIRDICDEGLADVPNR